MVRFVGISLAADSAAGFGAGSAFASSGAAGTPVCAVHRVVDAAVGHGVVAGERAGERRAPDEQ
ncbi:hypothetical protein [Haloferax massiliensis]|uniref:Uncharacterized protein n=1 Tax=Haloferax massiliensis TaxID=1476858 RepID=A0A0D6JS58_9EURY|nr:hypothetical protein BN996_02249 [Haloferax massiliensis]